LLDYTRLRWEDGERRLRDVPAASHRSVERVVEQTVAELRRRLGSAFTTQELVELYEGSDAWTMALAVRVAPREPLAWEHWVADAAFARYLRGAIDWQSSS
jgi:PhoPQ-activated pathogenicity-related protein